jgi:hypothetical protein
MSRHGERCSVGFCLRRRWTGLVVHKCNSSNYLGAATGKKTSINSCRFNNIPITPTRYSQSCQLSTSPRASLRLRSTASSPGLCHQSSATTDARAKHANTQATSTVATRIAEWAPEPRHFRQASLSDAGSSLGRGLCEEPVDGLDLFEPVCCQLALARNKRCQPR